MKRTVRKQPDRKVKRKRKNTEEPMEFDMIGILLSNYGMTGENLVREVFSNMNFWSLQQLKLVCKSWNTFISKDRILMLNIVRQTEPKLKNLFSQLSDNWGHRSYSKLDYESDSEIRYIGYYGVISS